jgi:hypothetical protein
MGMHLIQYIGVHLIHGRASHKWASTSYIGVHLIYGRASGVVISKGRYDVWPYSRIFCARALAKGGCDDYGRGDVWPYPARSRISCARVLAKGGCDDYEGGMR